MNHSKRSLNAILFLFCGMSVSGCASSDYTKAVEGFANATASAGKGLSQAEKVLDEDVYAELLRKALKKPNAVRPFKREDCLPGGAKRCRLVYRDSPTGHAHLLQLEATDANMRRVMDLVAAYAGHLGSIAAAGSAEEVKAGVAGVKTSIISAARSADAFNKQQGQKTTKIEERVSALAGPIGATVEYFIGKYLDSLKLEALREATNAVDPDFPKIAQALGGIARSALIVQQTSLGNAYDEATTRFENDPSVATRDRLVAAAHALDASLQIRPEDTFAALAAAHTKLTILLNDKGGSDDFWSQLQVAIVEANRIIDIVEQYQAAREKLSNEKGV